jgi:hypothetical protein
LICGGCFTDEHCDDGNPCTVDVCLKETCHNGNAPGSCDDGLFCTRGDTCVDGACIGGADPCEGLADCDEASDSCGGCFPAMVTAVGSRYLAVSPVNPDAYPMAIRVEGDGMDAKVSCVDLYVQAFCLGGPDDGALCGSDADCRRACAGGPVPGLPCTGNYQCAPSGRCEGRCDKGRLGPDPVFMPASKWGMILVGDAELAPDSLYWVTTVCDWGGGPFQSDPAGAITWRRGDVDGNGEVSAVDIAHIVDVIAQRIHGDVTVAGANVWDCLLDNSVNALDIVEAVNTLRSAPSLCPSPCE